jgi:hypothetical protein
VLSIITKENENNCAASIAGKATIIEAVTALKAVQRVFSQSLNLPKDDIKHLMLDVLEKDI